MTGPTTPPERWEPTREELVVLTAWMAQNDHSASDVAYCVEKPWKHKDLWDLLQIEQGLSE